MPDITNKFLRWCEEHGIEIDPRLELRVSPLDGSMSVFSRSDASVSIGESLVRIPKSAVLSTKNCSRSRDIVALCRDDPSLELSLALLTETLNGPESPWYGYLQSLPVGLVPIAMFWGINDDQDGIEAVKWIQGTEIEKLLTDTDGHTLLDHVNAYFEQTAKPLLHLHHPAVSVTDFYRAYSLVSSRAFLVDAYHGLSLVPIADAFNHVEDNHVHLESDYHVCTTCGSLWECPHDAESAGGGREPPSLAPADVDTCEMVSNLLIGPREEVFNTYEKGLTNAHLLCRYGFTLDVNENNIISWTPDELLKAEPEREARIAIWTKLIHQWPGYDSWDDLQLVYNPHKSYKDVYEDGVPKRITHATSLFNLNADGQISHHLWLMLVTLALPDPNVPLDRALSVAQLVARIQEHLEMGLGSEVTTLGPCSSIAEHGALLCHVAASAVRLCEAKLGSAHRSGMPMTSIGDLLDETPLDRPLARQAIAYALEERKLIMACHGAWLDVQERGLNVCRLEHVQSHMA